MKTKVCIVIGLWLAMVSLAYGQPAVLFEEESYDFGEVAQSDVLEHTFVFRNVGNETLIIQKVTSS